ncbi:hypothetical protein NN561_019953 [Cricetulus griseus]
MRRAPLRKPSKSCNLPCSVGRSGVLGREQSAAMTLARPPGLQVAPTWPRGTSLPEAGQAEADELRECATWVVGCFGLVTYYVSVGRSSPDPSGARWRR